MVHDVGEKKRLKVDDDTLLLDAEKPDGCTGKCNMMWSLRNPKWIPEYYKTDWRFAHPEKVGDWSINERDFDKVLGKGKVTNATLSRYSYGGMGCNDPLMLDLLFMRHHVLGWVHCVHRKNTGSSKAKHSYVYPWEVSERFMGDMDRVVVPCQHLQLFFEILMGKTLLPYESVRFGYVDFSKKITHYYVERVKTRTKHPLPTWDSEDCESLRPYWDTDIIVSYFAEGDEQLHLKRDYMGPAGVKETTHYITSLRGAFTPAMFLGCNYIAICQRPYKENAEFTKRLQRALEKRVPADTQILVKKTSTEGRRGRDTPDQSWILQQWSHTWTNLSASDSSDTEGSWGSV